ncbi:4-(cytidine 5'-diphospho)-2-C-methyl-D-erythritol kinase [Sulfobacillus harzensis]|uniref:4-diphosphocytidyl-2-C-methyl-D-erythritol kinase n=1 Tax=Sulfobacillus harzensis TaxID=2729629 RepID=A0A7Y0L540_9FIRM|nr:4-(cytidine 5'-diphospho)-2-C-methyl-D-erythritol kinase [Sulfobacillus harzensis]NMP23365.1 4-(cytidine 5'-diphospho)-2-C-methyl-D-erythritol kinase [Sulfobacillus harzensis]
MPWYQAPAKINLGLWVGPRDQSGFHPVDTVMQTVAFADQLYLEPSDHMLWESSRSDLPMDPANLVVRSYTWCAARIAGLPPIRGRLDKVIPVGAGLGGGSSDAAAVIRWALTYASELPFSETVHDSGELGMDVPFFVRGGTARAEGYGDILTTLPPMRPAGVVLANPGISLSTPRVYEAYDRMGKPSDGEQIGRVIEALKTGALPDSGDLINDLEEPALAVLPALREFRDLLQRTAEGFPIAMSGSGPTYFILGQDEDWAEWMARRLTARGVPWAQPTTVLDSWGKK